MTDPFGTTHYDRTGQTRIKEEGVTDHLDRAAEVLWEATCPDGLRAAMRPDCWAMAQALDAAGLLVTPERDAAVAAKALREAADDVRATLNVDQSRPLTIEQAMRAVDFWLRGRADRIEREAGESDADA